MYLLTVLMNTLSIRTSLSHQKEKKSKLHLIFHFSNSIILSIYMQSTLLVLSLIALMEFMMCKSCLYYFVLICGYAHSFYMENGINCTDKKL